ncbi:MAG: AraC family transcriptional regulator [Mameliella sp.]|nr:AraC family transcriptional regulator [Mameliella sp.]|tara:strand:- start:1988 stop:2890 length:903 start_codon:yes stop_codon:yes gene_type:complete
MPRPETAGSGLISPKELPMWVPGEVVSSSDGLEWNGISQCTYAYRGQDVDLPPMNTFMIVQYRHGITPMDRQFDGKWTRTRCAPGHFSLLSREVDTQWSWSDDIEVSHVYLDDTLLKRVARDTHDGDVGQVILHDVLQGVDPIVGHIIDELTVEAARRGPGGSLYAEALSVQLAVHLLRSYAAICKPTRPCESSLSPRELACLEEFINAHIHEKITLEQMAKLFGLGTWTLNRRLKKSIGQSAYGYVQLKRLARAREMLRTNCEPLKQIAAACGFSDQAHMTRAFRKAEGVTPGQYRARH